MCLNGNATASFKYFNGKYYNFPEQNCCACGKTNDIFNEAVSTEYSLCTHDPLNSDTRRTVMYCEFAKDSKSSCETPVRRALHCVWNPPFKTPDDTEWLLLKNKTIDPS